MRGDPAPKTKVVLRRLPPAISQQAVMEQVDSKFADRYDWASFRPGNNSQKNYRYSRVYINFKRPEDVLEFAEIFNGHTFVNEKGAQFKAVVEYAPSQQIPKSSKKDGREGTIVKDPEYLEFLELIAKPVEHLPSAEIQLERKEAERVVAGKEAPVTTPLMQYIRQQRAAKSVSRRSASTRLSTKGAGILGSSSSPSKRGPEKRRVGTSSYVARGSNKDGNYKEKPTYILVPRRDEQQKDKTIAAISSSGAEAAEDPFSGGTSGSSLPMNARKDKVVILKGRGARNDSNASEVAGQLQTATPSGKSTAASKQEQQLDSVGRTVKTILSNKETRHAIPSQFEQDNQVANLERDKRPPRSANFRSIVKDHILDGADKSNYDEKQGANPLPGSNARNRDRPDRVVWTSRRSDRSSSGSSTQHSYSDIQHQSNSQENHSQVDDYGDRKSDILTARREDTRTHGAVRGPSVENGSNRNSYRRGPPRGPREVESMFEGKPPKRGSPGFGSHERQVWVQKSGSAS